MTERDPSSVSDTGDAARRRWTYWTPLLLVLAFGIGLRTVQYFGFVDMWYDELAVARNVEERSIPQLLRPLDHRQVAPFGFLATVDVATEILGVAEPGLRLAPFLFSLASVFLFWRVASRFAAGSALLAALALFAFSPALVWYSSSVKPYGSDVTISLLLVWLALRYRERPDDSRRATAAGVLGAFALLFSFPAVPTAAILTTILLLDRWRRRPKPAVRPLATMAGLWIVGMGVAGLISRQLVHRDVDSWMRDIHSQSFPPPHPLEAVRWAIGTIYDVYTHGLVFFPPSNPVLVLIVTTPLVLGAIGLVVLASRRWSDALILLTPPIAGVAAAAVRLLPFFDRLGLHASWPFFVLAGAGLQRIRTRATGRWRPAPLLLSLIASLPLVAVVLLMARPPYEPPIPSRRVVEQLAQEIRESDRIYVYTQARHAMAYYGRRAGIDQWLQGERQYENPRGYLREIDALRGGPRVWFFWVDLDRSEHPAWICDYLETIGTELRRIPAEEPRGAGAILYDLSDPRSLLSASAETFPLPSDPRTEP